MINGVNVMKQIILLALLLFASGSLRAQIGDEGGRIYHYWGAGIGAESFNRVSGVGGDGGGAVARESRASISAEVMGFYWPMRDGRTLVGVVSNGAFDGDAMSRASFDLTQFTTSGSVLHFVTDTVGAGFLLRGEIGMAGRRIEATDDTETSTRIGLGVTLGVGYGFLVGGNTVIVGGNVALRRIGSQNFGGVGATIGFLW